MGFEALRGKDMDDLVQRGDEIGRRIAYDLRTRPSRKSSNHNAFSARLLSDREYLGYRSVLQMPRPEIGHIRIAWSEPGGLMSVGWGSMCAIAIMIARTRVKVQCHSRRRLEARRCSGCVAC
jgi:hypothetical protein